MVARGWGWGKGGRVSKEHTLPVTRQMRSEGLVHSVVTTVGNTVVEFKFAKRVTLKYLKNWLRQGFEEIVGH